MTPFDYANRALSDPRVVRQQRENHARRLPIAANDYSWPEPRTIRTVMRGRWLEAIVDAAIVAVLFGAIIMLVECFG